jgi:hypothetical protein
LYAGYPNPTKLDKEAIPTPKIKINTPITDPPNTVYSLGILVLSYV